MLDDLLERRETGRRFPIRDPAVWASTSERTIRESDPQPGGFGVQNEYELLLRVGVEFVSNKAQYPEREREAIRQLKYELYKDIIGDIFEAQNLCDDTQVRKILNSMLTKIGIYGG